MSDLQEKQRAATEAFALAVVCLATVTVLNAVVVILVAIAQYCRFGVS